MKAGDTIIIERRAIYANSTSTERAYTKVVDSVKDIEGQTAKIVRFKKDKRVFRLSSNGNELNCSYPRAARYEIVG